MAASTGQGRSFTTFLVGFTVICAGIASISTGLGKFLIAVGVVIFIGSMLSFLKLKPLEGKPAQNSSPAGMKALGAFLCAIGWVITLYGMRIATATSGRLVLALIGIGVSLFGMIYVLPAAFNKHANWKA
jgi:hypothetical protein